jgi:serine/threonine protein phosphatase 1
MNDVLTFAVGDIHGCFDKLRALLRACDDLGAGHDVRYVFVGDYIDRGPDARQVIDLLMVKQRTAASQFVCLRGNHEQLLTGAAAAGRSDRDLMQWWANGGEQTLDSYGVKDPSALPSHHLAWIKALPLRFADPKRLYVHAGLRPDVALADQTEDDLLWIREPFLSSNTHYGALVVHGHTPTASGRPDLRANRLNLDTGACFGGELTAAAFRDHAARPAFFVDSLGTVWQP